MPIYRIGFYHQLKIVWATFGPSSDEGDEIENTISAIQKANIPKHLFNN